MRSGPVLGAFFVSVALFWACGSSTDNQTSQQHAGGSAGTTTGGSGGTSAGGGSGGTNGGASGFGGIPLGGGAGTSPIDASDGAVVSDAGWFQCGGCACDGTTHYCIHTSGGAANPMPPPDDAAVCDYDAATGSNGCVPLPAGCDPPSCDCVGVPFGGACTCTDAGGGILVQCFLP
jgi:hypothetical protein